jgi:4'-phosphopantetheinyl transferase
LRVLLSTDECQRAARFHFERHRRRFIACRGQVRRILGNYLDTSAAQVRFQYGRMGKPALDAPWNGSPIRFNVSNSHEAALCAVALDRELGVDIEHIRAPSDFDGLAARFFARSEVALLRSLPAERRLEAFFNCWTRKEAVLKAVGTGLAFPLDKVVVTLTPDEPARLLAYDDDPEAAADWWLARLEPGPGYMGALASCGGPLKVETWQSR